MTDESNESNVRLSMTGITVRFGSTLALAGVDLQVGAGEIVGLLGHNGAGKSTLLNVATGVISAASGEFSIDGVTVEAKPSPRGMAQLGVTVIHQEPALIASLSVLDNLFLAHAVQPARSQKVKLGREALERVGGTHISHDSPVEILSLGERQVVDLARGVLSGEVKVLLLDEPTAGLGHDETRALHNVIRAFADSGTAVVYVSHRLPDIVDICDRIVVLRGGATVFESGMADMSMKTLAHALAPEAASEGEWEANVGEPRLVLEEPDGDLVFNDGEIVGLFGMAGGDQFHLLDRLFGRSSDELRASLSGESYAARSPSHAMSSGVHMVPGDRETDGLIAGLSASDNTFLPWFGKGWSNRQKVATEYRMIRESLNILGPGASAPIASFSGGNRQKHLIARWIFPVRPRLLLLSQPTQGVDIGAKRDIRRALRALADSGVCIIVASAEADEIASLCSRVFVMSSGKHKQIPASPSIETMMLTTLLEITPSQEKLL